GNSAVWAGGGALLYGGGGTLNNSTISGNSAGWAGGGAYLSGSGTLNNCIVWSNTATDSGNDIYNNHGDAIRYTCASDGMTDGVDGCITNNPLFMDGAKSNFQLQASSPCINAGDNTYAPTNVTPYDLAGNPRISYGTVDMGAYEWLLLPEMTILGVNGAVIADDEAVSVEKGTDFGEMSIGSQTTVSMTISNAGAADLYILGLSTNGAGADAFTISVGVAADTPLQSGGSTFLSVGCAPQSEGVFTASVHIANNSATTPYIVNLAGTASSGPGAGTLAIEVTPASGTWQMTNPPAGYTGPRSGTGNLSPIAAPAGTYTVAWGELAGYEAPAMQAANLSAGQTLVFTGIYMEVSDDLEPPKGVSATDGAHTNYVRVTWRGPAMSARGEVISYEIRRATANDPAQAAWLADVPAGAAAFNPLEGERIVNRSEINPPSGNSSFIIQNSYFYYDDYAVQPGVSYYYWVRARTATQVSRLSYVGMGYAGLTPDQAEGTADLAVSDLVFLPVNMRPDTTAGTVSLRLKNLGPDALTASTVEFNFYMGTADDDMLWVGGDRRTFDLPVGQEELVILTPTSRRGIVARGDQSGLLAAHLRARHAAPVLLAAARRVGIMWDPNLANNTTEAAGQVRLGSSIRESRRRGLTDMDGDGKSDLLVLRTDRGQFMCLMSGGYYTQVQFVDTGVSDAGYLPSMGDYDGDGILDLCLYDPNAGMFYAILSSTEELVTCGLGGVGCVPVPGDYDGDGKSDPGVYHEATGYWEGFFSSENYTVRRYTWVGGPDYVPVPGDYDGDGKADPAAYLEAAGYCQARLSGAGYAQGEMALGGPGWVVVPGDYDGDGRADAVVYHEAAGYWHGLMSNHGQGYVEAGGHLGGPGWLPVAGDFDGDGKSDPVVFNPWIYNPLNGLSVGYWEGLLSSRGYASVGGVFGGSEYQPAME
ncbi:MAG: choice-of-anchor D domain-containing protein, partial [Kiritimatiellia bacterium]